MTNPLDEILAIVQHDPGGRGLRTDPDDNLITATAGDFAAACRAVADLDSPRVIVVTGFSIPTAEPPCGETDGPPGALFLARSLTPLRCAVTLATDGTSLPALRAGAAAAGLHDVPVIELPDATDEPHQYRAEFDRCAGNADVLIALERVGPSHETGLCHSMRGHDMTRLTRPAHHLFETDGPLTIGIGDGGNEIGMGKVPRETIGRNVANGRLVACRVRTHCLIVAGVSNWGAYALAAGVRLLRRAAFDPNFFDVGKERRLLDVMVEAGPLIDGVTRKRSATVDGLPFEVHADVLRRIGEVLLAGSASGG